MHTGGCAAPSNVLRNAHTLWNAHVLLPYRHSNASTVSQGPQLFWTGKLTPAAFRQNASLVCATITMHGILIPAVPVVPFNAASQSVHTQPYSAPTPELHSSGGPTLYVAFHSPRAARTAQLAHSRASTHEPPAKESTCYLRNMSRGTGMTRFTCAAAGSRCSKHQGS